MNALLPTRFPVICGCTASGKSSLAVAVAQWLKRERGIASHILAADAFQIYRGMDIGTAKPDTSERGGVEHTLIDLVEPRERFTVDDWLSRAEAEIAACRAAGIVPIVVGGTHLYVKALMEGLFDGPPANEEIRARLGAMPREELRAMLERLDSPTAARLHANDTRRTIRALEVLELTGTPISEHQRQWQAQARGREDAVLVCLHWETEALNRRINERVRRMRAAGLLDEVRGLVESDALGPQSAEALGYKQLLPIVRRAHGDGVWPPRSGDLDDAFERIKIDTRRFAKNQRTWLKQLRITPGAVNVEMRDGVDLDQIAAGAVEAMNAPGM